jgi:hypothetical protein
LIGAISTLGVERSLVAAMALLLTAIPVYMAAAGALPDPAARR